MPVRHPELAVEPVLEPGLPRAVPVEHLLAPELPPAQILAPAQIAGVPGSLKDHKVFLASTDIQEGQQQRRLRAAEPEPAAARVVLRHERLHALGCPRSPPARQVHGKDAHIVRRKAHEALPAAQLLHLAVLRLPQEFVHLDRALASHKAHGLAARQQLLLELSQVGLHHSVRVQVDGDLKVEDQVHVEACKVLEGVYGAALLPDVARNPRHRPFDEPPIDDVHLDLRTGRYPRGLAPGLQP
mmetsp:Transcript_64601/g.183371  ORF Transcript_64601/g.183371 Transcript_64601/m.183371 type:complete len:242 (-) Transcript_64601:52-777(-)